MKDRISIICFLLILLSLLSGCKSDQDTLDTYTENDFSADSIYGSFQYKYKNAKSSSYSWIENPEDIALKLIESNKYWTDPFIPNSIETRYDENGNAVVVITDDFCA